MAAVLLIQDLVSREFDRKLYLTSLTYPRQRHRFLAGRVAAAAIMLCGLLVTLSVLLAAFTTWIGHTYAQATPPDLGLPYVVTIGFVALDLLVVLAIGTLIAVTTTTPSFVLIGTLGFMVVARSYSAIVALLTRDGTLVGNADSYQSSLSLLGYLLPDLAALDVRMISLYGDWQFLPGDWPMRIVSTLAYAAALFALSVWALNRKKFS
jgi:ABC-type transport system involved in multi-copper enzyme maturation permease subunit